MKSMKSDCFSEKQEACLKQLLTSYKTDLL